jgi:hypothetical protein
VSARSSFYFLYSLLVAFIVAVGFLPTLDAKLIHPAAARPRVLYLHAVTFTAWVLFFISQTALARTKRITWHRRLGLIGLGLGVLIPVLGVITARTITLLRLTAGASDAEQSFIVPVFDMTAFAVVFSLAIHFRRRPDYHSRLMLIASAGLTVAAFARFPSWLIPDNAFYVAVDLLILIAIARDWIATHRIHPVYLYVFPGLVIAQAATMWITLTNPSAWHVLAERLLR